MDHKGGGTNCASIHSKVHIIRTFSSLNILGGVGVEFPPEIPVSFPVENCRKFFFRGKKPPENPLSGISVFQRKFPRLKFTEIPVSSLSFQRIIIFAGKNSGGKLETLSWGGIPIFFL